jgi:anti-sigma factor RsiW
MNCKNAQSLLSAYLDDELNGREMLDIRAHLHECGECTEELQSIESVKRMLEASPVPAPSPGFEDRLVSSVLSHAKVPSEPKRISILTLTGIAAASMLVTMLLLNSMHHESPNLADKRDSMPMDLMRNDRAFNAGADPLTGSPVAYTGH